MAAFEMRSEVISRVPMCPDRSLLILLLYSYWISQHQIKDLCFWMPASVLLSQFFFSVWNCCPCFNLYLLKYIFFWNTYLTIDSLKAATRLTSHWAAAGSVEEIVHLVFAKLIKQCSFYSIPANVANLRSEWGACHSLVVAIKCLSCSASYSQHPEKSL